MIEYAAFLRGINISGKNKINMAELKRGFEELGFVNVFTVLNSGNVGFSSEVPVEKTRIEKMILNKFGSEIPVHIVEKDVLRDVLMKAPEWWNSGDKEKYDNLIFIITQDSAEDICEMIGEATEGQERIEIYKNVIFWTFNLKKYQKCNWWKKTASAGIAEKLTIRTANTVIKIYNKISNPH